MSTRARSGTGRSARRGAAEGEQEQASVGTDLTAVVGQNLRRLRGLQGLSLEKLANASGVSRAMLSQIELAQSTPTINVVWKIATALGVPFSALLQAQTSEGPQVLRLSQARLLTNVKGTFVSRALFPFTGRRKVEFYELRLAARGIEEADAHPPGTSENLVVAKGEVAIDVAGRTEELSTGDAIVFEADVPHAYRNIGAVEAVMYLVMTYAHEVG